jgi:catechol 2,3-dioxygenase-like lactoylglutathione lyase family enzyme
MAMTTKHSSPARSLHYVLKIADRNKTIDFLLGLGMTVLRHEEFEQGCEAACNGPYDGKWSKTMIGFGVEDSNFVLELTYNYTVKSYEVGNDFAGISVSNSSVLRDLKAKDVGLSQEDGSVAIKSPDGYHFLISEGPHTELTQIIFNVSDLDRSLAFWCSFLGFHRIDNQSLPNVALIRSTGKIPNTIIHLQQLPNGTSIHRGTGYGRIAFACPGESLESLQKDVITAGYTVHTPYVSLDTPGKATVQVVILQDPDGLEICFVGETGFRELSVVDPQALKLLNEAMENDKSAEWEAKRVKMEEMMQAKGV